MTALLLDVGNSRLKWALARAGNIELSGALEHGGDPASTIPSLNLPAEAVAPPLPGGVRRHGSIVDVCAANVTGVALGAALAEAIRQRLGLETQFATVHKEHSGFTVSYADPSRLGVDRWLQMLALWRECKAAFAVASAGTALTFDAVDAHGHHLGGVIAPGLLTAQRVVLGATRFPAEGPGHSYLDGLGQDTDACVRQGALHACAGLIERLAARFVPAGTSCVLTGGDAAIIAPHVAGFWSLRPDLVIEGLPALAGQVRAQ